MAAYRGACGTAGDLAELAVTLTPLTQPGRQRRVVLAAQQRFDSSDPARACSLLENIIDTVQAGPARAELWRRLARYRAFCGGPMAAWTASLGHALDEAGDDAGLRAVIMMDQTVAASNAGNFPEAIRTACAAGPYSARCAGGWPWRPSAVLGCVCDIRARRRLAARPDQSRNRWSAAVTEAEYGTSP